MQKLQEHVGSLNLDTGGAPFVQRRGTSAQNAKCVEFNNDFDGLLFDSANAAGNYQATYASGCGMNDLTALFTVRDESQFRKSCSTSGTSSATSCGSTGFYARARSLGAKYNGMLAADCKATLTIGSSTVDLGPAAGYLGMVSQITGMVCVSHGSDYCWPRFMASFNGVQPTVASLTNLCTPCTDTLLQSMFVAMGGGDSAKAQSISMSKSIELMCSKVGTTLCYPEFQSTLESETSTATAAEKSLYYCENQCAQVVMSKTIEMMKIEGQDYTMAEGQFTASCFKHNNRYCQEYLDKAGSRTTGDYWTPLTQSASCAAPVNGPDTSPFPANPTACNTQCTTDITALQTNWGCCFTTLLEATSTTFQSWFTAQTTACSSNAVPRCVAEASADTVVTTVCMANLAFSYTGSNYATVAERVKEDVAMQVGVQTKLCTAATSFTQAAGTTPPGSCLQITCSPPSAVITGNVAVLLDTFSASSTASRRQNTNHMTFGRVSTLPADSRIDTSIGVTGQTTGATACGSGACPSSNVNLAGGSTSGAESVRGAAAAIVTIVAAGAVYASTVW